MCLDIYFVGANALQLDSTCAIDSCAFSQILHLTSDSSLDFVFLALYSFVRSSCSWSSLIPAIVCVGDVFQFDIHAKLSPSRSLSSQRAGWSFHCHVCSLTSSQCLFCKAFLVTLQFAVVFLLILCWGGSSARWMWI